MSTSETPRNRVKSCRLQQGWSQAELAERAGISRTAVSAVEGDRLVPSVTAAIALARVLGTTVEALFGHGEAVAQSPAWAFEPHASTHYWQAEVRGQQWLYPAASAPMFTPLPDGAAPGNESASRAARIKAQQTLVVACCDPAAGILASEYARVTGFRMLVLHRSSRESLELLRQGKVHLAGLHLSTEEDAAGNGRLVRQTLGSEFRLLRVAQWQEGIVAAASTRIRSVRAALQSRLTWVGREPGSGARQCLDRLFGDRAGPRRLARDHRGVAEAIRSGWADAGICVQLTGMEAGLAFLPVQKEAYDLCIPHAALDDPRVQALLKVVRSANYRQLLSGLPGYDAAETGSVGDVN